MRKSGVSNYIVVLVKKIYFTIEKKRGNRYELNYSRIIFLTTHEYSDICNISLVFSNLLGRRYSTYFYKIDKSKLITQNLNFLPPTLK